LRNFVQTIGGGIRVSSVEEASAELFADLRTNEVEEEDEIEQALDD
jgi:hypothetical protein